MCSTSVLNLVGVGLFGVDLDYRHVDLDCKHVDLDCRCVDLDCKC